MFSPKTIKTESFTSVTNSIATTICQLYKQKTLKSFLKETHIFYEFNVSVFAKQ